MRTLTEECQAQLTALLTDALALVERTADEPSDSDELIAALEADIELLQNQIADMQEELAVWQDAAMPRERHPLRRIVGLRHYVHNGDEYYPQLSCGHEGGTPWSRAAIEKAIAERRRMLCPECESDV